MPVTPPDFRPDPPHPPVPPHWTAPQREAVHHARALNVEADWFFRDADPRDADARVAAIAVGRDFVWSFSIAPDGDTASSEAALGEWSTGISA